MSNASRVWRRVGALIVVGAAASLAGCMTGPVSLSPSTIPLNRGDYSVVGPATGRAWGFGVLGYPLSEPNQAGKARDRALQASGGDAMVNVAVDFTSINLLVVSIFFTTVYGDSVKVIR